MQFSTLAYFENPFSVKISREVICQMERFKIELRKYGYLYYLTDNRYIRSLIVDELIRLTHDLYVLIMKNSIPDFRIFHKRGYSFWKNPTLYKTSMCENWKFNGKCKFGKKCWYAHGYHELRQQIKFNEYFPFTSENLVYAALSQSGILMNPLYELSSIYSQTQCNLSQIGNIPTRKQLANFPPLYPPGTVFWSEYCIRPLCSHDKLTYDERISKYEHCDVSCLNRPSVQKHKNAVEETTPETVLSLIINSKSVINDDLILNPWRKNDLAKNKVQNVYYDPPNYSYRNSSYIIPPSYLTNLPPTTSFFHYNLI